MKIAVVGHVEHVTLGRVAAVPAPGDVLHLREPRFTAAGGGGITFSQLCKSDEEIHFFTAIGSDDGARQVREAIEGRGRNVHVHAAFRSEPHPRVVVMIDAEGRRTILVTGSPLQVRASDSLPWSIFASCDAVYFTGADSLVLQHARAAKSLVVTARRAPVLREAGVTADVVLGSVSDSRENAPIESYHPPPRALVLTDGARPIQVIRSDHATLVEAPPVIESPMGDYGAGDSFAGAVTYFLATGMSVEDACAAAGPFGAAILRGLDPLETQRELPRAARAPSQNDEPK